MRIDSAWMRSSVVAGVALVVLLAGAAGATAQEARVFFESPGDGSQHSEDVISIEFGAENYPISAIPEGFDQETGTPREGVGHYHLGYNTGCLPVGEITRRARGGSISATAPIRRRSRTRRPARTS